MAQDTAYQAGVVVASEASADERSAFIRRTYAHLAGALGLFVLLLTVFMRMPVMQKLGAAMMSSQWAWIGVLVAFMVVGSLASWFAYASESKAGQYFGLILYTTLEAVIFVPLLMIVFRFAGDAPHLLTTAGVITGTLFLGLTGIVFITKKDFSFLRSGLLLFALVAIGVIIAGLVWGFHLGLAFSGLMIILAGGFILYETSNVLHKYPTDRHVGASLALFASVALLLWYVIIFLMQYAGD